MHAVTRDQEVRRWRKRRGHGSDGDGRRSEQSKAGGPQAHPYPAADDQTECPARHRRKERDGAPRGCDRMRKGEQAGDRLAANPPERRPEPKRIKRERRRLARHDHERRQRDRDDVREDAVKSCAVEME